MAQVLVSIDGARRRGGEGLVNALLSQGKAHGNRVEIARGILHELLGQHQPERPSTRWPIWARIASRFRAIGDRGVGDTLEHWQGLMGGAQFGLWHCAVFGPQRPCPDCPKIWNILYPYGA